MSVVLITGCSSGFGKLAALEFARRGDRVYASMRDLSKSQPLLSDAAKEGLEIDTIRLDVTEPSSIDAAVKQILDQAGRIDALVNNAGVVALGPVEYFSDGELTKVLETNVIGLIRTTRAVLPSLRAQGGGTIINIGSISGLISWPLGG